MLGGMMRLDTQAAIMYLACIICLFIVGRLFYVPIRYIVKLSINSILGAIVLYIINLVGSSFGFHIGIHIGTAIIVGILGIPGAVLLIVLQCLL